MPDNYTKKLEEVIKQMLTPLKGIPFSLVIESLSNHKVIPFNKNDVKDLAVLETLKAVAKKAAEDVNIKGILRPRPNEVGNDIEPFVEKTLNANGFKASTPITKGGKHKSTGYPDLEFKDKFGRVNYLECKSFNKENVDTTQRSFYLSPSEDFKITTDAHHFVISFEIYVDGQKEDNHIYKCAAWKILSVENLEVDVKYEFNSDNARMYKADLILAEGKV
jgi:hypothetical protein